jgi:heptaprenyl diphosphate synthase
LHLLESGGKRLRPMLVLAAADGACGLTNVSREVIEAAAAVELLHLATLYHDDVLDSALIRRGQPSANALWGNARAVLGGDVLLSLAYTVAAHLGTDELLRICRTLTEVCAGQIAETYTQFDTGRTVRQYFASIEGKTAALLASSCWLGARAAGATRETVTAAERFGFEVGVAFQIIDDVLDLCADEEVLGKPAGNDLREGVFTLPVLLALADDRSLLSVLRPEIDDVGIQHVRCRVRALNTDVEAIDTALEHLTRAVALLDSQPLSERNTGFLRSVAEAVLEPLVRSNIRTVQLGRFVQ